MGHRASLQQPSCGCGSGPSLPHHMLRRPALAAPRSVIDSPPRPPRPRPQLRRRCAHQTAPDSDACAKRQSLPPHTQPTGDSRPEAPRAAVCAPTLRGAAPADRRVRLRTADQLLRARGGDAQREVRGRGGLAVLLRAEGAAAGQLLDVVRQRRQLQELQSFGRKASPSGVTLTCRSAGSVGWARSQHAVSPLLSAASVGAASFGACFAAHLSKLSAAEVAIEARHDDALAVLLDQPQRLVTQVCAQAKHAEQT
jgi:hypothetical protein